MGRRRERWREGKLGEGLRWLTVHAGCLTYRECIPSSKQPTHSVHMPHCVCGHFGGEKEESRFKSKGINERRIITAGINHFNFRPHFPPMSLIWSTHSTIGSTQENVVVSHTNNPRPLSFALTLICVGQVHHPVLPQVPVNGCQYVGLAGRQRLEGESMRG